MDATQIVITIVTTLGTSGALTIIFTGLVKHLNGSAGRERARNTTMRDQRNEAWADAEKERTRADREQARADREARNRRLTEEYASQLRRDCTEHGVTQQELRPWPRLETEPPKGDTS